MFRSFAPLSRIGMDGIIVMHSFATHNDNKETNAAGTSPSSLSLCVNGIRRDAFLSICVCAIINKAKV